MLPGLLLAAAVLLAAWGLAVALTGGVDSHLFGVPVRSRDPFRAVAASLALFVFLGVRYRADLAALLDRTGAAFARHAVAVAIACAGALAAHGMLFGAFAVGGSDSYCYVNQAYDWAAGRWRPLPVRIALPFETSDEMQVPLGYRVAGQPHTIAPVCASGCR